MPPIFIFANQFAIPTNSCQYGKFRQFRVNRVFESTHPSDTFTYIWLLRNEKPASHRRRVMIVDARQQFEKEP